MVITHAGPPVEVTAQAEEYLEGVCRILDRGGLATPTELAREMSVSPPSVLGMIRRLQEQQLVTYSRRNGARLTARGRDCAEVLRRRHRLAECLLTDLLGMPWERAHVIACRFEHILDDEVEGYLLDALRHPTTCPHGNPLQGKPDARWQPLSTLQPGEAAVVRCVQDESEPMLAYLNQLHLHPGARVAVRAFAPFNGPLTVDVNGEGHALSRETADRLLVELEGDAA